MKSLDIRWSSIGVAALGAVAIAATLATSDASAAQRFGRDSVYAWDHSAPSGSTVIGTSPSAQSFGRDSVYATGGGATRVATIVKTRIDRYAGEVYGRAGVPTPWFNSRSKAG